MDGTMMLFLAGAFIGAIGGFLVGIATVVVLDRAVTLPW